MKSVLQPRVRDFVAWQLEHYRDNKMQLEEYKRDMIPSPTAKYGGTTGHGNEAHRSTEDIVERISSSAYIRNLEQTVKAIDYVISRLDSTDLDLVKLVYFRIHCPAFRDYTTVTMQTQVDVVVGVLDAVAKLINVLETHAFGFPEHSGNRFVRLPLNIVVNF